MTVPHLDSLGPQESPALRCRHHEFKTKGYPCRLKSSAMLQRRQAATPQ